MSSSVDVPQNKTESSSAESDAGTSSQHITGQVAKQDGSNNYANQQQIVETTKIDTKVDTKLDLSLV